MLSRASFLDVLQNRRRCGQSEGMAHKSASKEGDTRSWIGIIAILPEAAVECIHERRLAGQYADRHAPAHHFTVGDKIGTNAEQGLDAARMRAEACDDFVKDESCPGLGCQLT